MLRFLHKRRSLYLWALVALTETAVVIPWMIFCYRILIVGDWPGALPSAWLLLVIYGAASLLEAGNRRPEGASSWRRALSMPVGVLIGYAVAYQFLPAAMRTGFLSSNIAWGIAPAAAYLWYRGTAAVLDGVEYGLLFQSYAGKCVVGVLGVIAIVVSGGAGDGRVLVLLVWSIILMFAAGLTALVVAREQSLQAGQAHTGDAGEGRSDTTPIVTGVVIALLLLTVLASYLVSVDRLAAVTHNLIGGIGAVFAFITQVVMLVLFRWAALLYSLIAPFMNWYGAKKAAYQPVTIGQGNPDDLPPPQNTTYLLKTDTLMPYIKAGILIAVVAVAAVMLYRLARKARSHLPDEEEERVSLGFWQNLRADLGNLLRRGRAPAPAAVRPAEVLDPRDPRSLYRRLQAWGSDLGRPRQAGETPSAYSTALAGRHPDREQPIDAVTAVYNQSRYGAAGPAPAAVDQAVRAVSELEHLP